MDHWTLVGFNSSAFFFCYLYTVWEQTLTLKVQTATFQRRIWLHTYIGVNSLFPKICVKSSHAACIQLHFFPLGNYIPQDVDLNPCRIMMLWVGHQKVQTIQFLSFFVMTAKEIREGIHLKLLKRHKCHCL